MNKSRIISTYKSTSPLVNGKDFPQLSSEHTPYKSDHSAFHQFFLIVTDEKKGLVFL